MYLASMGGTFGNGSQVDTRAGNQTLRAAVLPRRTSKTMIPQRNFRPSHPFILVFFNSIECYNFDLRTQNNPVFIQQRWRMVRLCGCTLNSPRNDPAILKGSKTDQKLMATRFIVVRGENNPCRTNLRIQRRQSSKMRQPRTQQQRSALSALPKRQQRRPRTLSSTTIRITRSFQNRRAAGSEDNPALPPARAIFLGPSISESQVSLCISAPGRTSKRGNDLPSGFSLDWHQQPAEWLARGCFAAMVAICPV
jgi:hypothetical protein